MPVILLQCGIENTNRLLLRLDSIYYSHELVLTLFAVCAILVVIFWKDNYSEDFFQFLLLFGVLTIIYNVINRLISLVDTFQVLQISSIIKITFICWGGDFFIRWTISRFCNPKSGMSLNVYYTRPLTFFVITTICLTLITIVTVDIDNLKNIIKLKLYNVPNWQLFNFNVVIIIYFIYLLKEIYKINKLPSMDGFYGLYNKLKSAKSYGVVCDQFDADKLFGSFFISFETRKELAVIRDNSTNLELSTAIDKIISRQFRKITLLDIQLVINNSAFLVKLSDEVRNTYLQDKIY